MVQLIQLGVVEVFLVPSATDDLDPESVETVTEELPRYLDLYADWLDTQEG